MLYLQKKIEVPYHCWWCSACPSMNLHVSVSETRLSVHQSNMPLGAWSTSLDRTWNLHFHFGHWKLVICTEWRVFTRLSQPRTFECTFHCESWRSSTPKKPLKCRAGDWENESKKNYSRVFTPCQSLNCGLGYSELSPKRLAFSCAVNKNLSRAFTNCHQW